MKNNVFKSASAAILLASAFIFNCSCSKNEVPRPVYEVTFYTGVNPDDAACIYKNSELLHKLETDSWINGLALMSDGSVYACGEIITDMSVDSMVSVPAIWKDGKSSNVDFGTFESGCMNDMISTGSSWLCCGTLQSADGKQGVIIKDGKVVYRSEKGISFQNMDLGVSGDCYVVGKQDKTTKLFRISSSSWTLGSTEIITGDEGGYTWSPTCIHVGTESIAIGLDRINDSTFETDAFCWMNMERGILNVEYESSINDITFFSGYLVAGGCHMSVTPVGEKEVDINTEAVQWVGGMPQDFSLGCTGNSELALLMNWNNIFFFQCVEHDGGLLFFNDASLIDAIKFDKKPYVSCWDVSVKEYISQP